MGRLARPPVSRISRCATAGGAAVWQLIQVLPWESSRDRHALVQLVDHGWLLPVMPWPSLTDPLRPLIAYPQVSVERFE
ncbi:protein of unknown function [Cupriavidus taiwanensis]|nr:protein of unknown function [Cupriavidus taiwanensis]